MYLYQYLFFTVYKDETIPRVINYNKAFFKKLQLVFV